MGGNCPSGKLSLLVIVLVGIIQGEVVQFDVVCWKLPGGNCLGWWGRQLTWNHFATCMQKSCSFWISFPSRIMREILNIKTLLKYRGRTSSFVPFCNPINFLFFTGNKKYVTLYIMLKWFNSSPMIFWAQWVNLPNNHRS